MDMYHFYTGKSFDAYEHLGCHLSNNGALFRVFAPEAARISLIGDFNNWTEMQMEKYADGNFWECHVDGAREGMMYKYRIYRQDGRFIDHADPYGFGMEPRPQTASVIRNLGAYQFHDQKWMEERTDMKDRPLNIYEVHMGSWKTNPKNANGWYRYEELADKLIPYVKENGYNYIELLPLCEHPSDNSWGYQITGFYSPTSRYGTADGLKEFIDKCHQQEIGIILDFVPVHFALDDYALADFDGTPLYEYPHTDVGNSEWGSKNFNHSRGEVQSFIQSCANYWLHEYHFDGLRMDAISNLIYWQGNPNRGENISAVNFLKRMNQGLKDKYPSIILAAEDSTAYPKVTDPVTEGGLGFDYKWDMGWMNDTLEYMKTSPENRTREYHKLTFSMMYFYSEKFILPFSHDEVVHGKATIVQKMNGQYEDKFPQARVLYLYMMAHPGKKLNFMGNELGQLREWDETREQDWDILQYPVHDSFHRFATDLNRIYLSNPALYKKDYEPDGFLWITCHEEEKCVYAFERCSKKQRILAVFNLSNKVQSDILLQIKECSKLKLIITTEEKIYGGNIESGKKSIHPFTKNTFSLTMQPYSAALYTIKKEKVPKIPDNNDIL